MRRRLPVLVAIAFAALLALGSAPAASSARPEAQQRIPLTMGFVSFVAQGFPFYAAEAIGSFEQEGLALDVSALGSSPLVATALVSGSLDIGVPDITAHVRAVERGGNLVWFISQMAPPIYGLLARPEIQSYADLRGRTVIVDSPNGITAILTRRMLGQAGLRDDDVNRVFAGATPDRLAALQAGAVDAAILLQPFDFTAERAGYRRLGNSNEVVSAMEFSGYSARPEWLIRNEDAVARFIRGYLAGLRWLYDPANKEAAIQALSTRTRLAPEDARATYELYVERVRAFPDGGRVNLVGMQNLLDALAEVGDLPTPTPPPSKYVSNAYLERFGQ
jgi:ABC-type nitrate/sulfonate/bicarbonate transport system substrate-binding protein